MLRAGFLDLPLQVQCVRKGGVGVGVGRSDVCTEKLQCSRRAGRNPGNVNFRRVQARRAILRGTAQDAPIMCWMLQLWLDIGVIGHDFIQSGKHSHRKKGKRVLSEKGK